MAEKGRLYFFNLRGDLYQELRQYVRKDGPAWASVDSATSESDGSLSFDLYFEEIESIIEDLNHQSVGGLVIAELIRQKSSQDRSS